MRPPTRGAPKKYGRSSPWMHPCRCWVEKKKISRINFWYFFNHRCQPAKFFEYTPKKLPIKTLSSKTQGDEWKTRAIYCKRMAVSIYMKKYAVCVLEMCKIENFLSCEKTRSLILFAHLLVDWKLYYITSSSCEKNLNEKFSFMSNFTKLKFIELTWWVLTLEEGKFMEGGNQICEFLFLLKETLVTFDVEAGQN